MSKAKSSSNILKDIGVNKGNVRSSHLVNYQDKTRDCNDKTNRREQDPDHRSSKYYSTLESSLKTKGREAMKAVDAFMMTSNTNHHYMLNHNNPKNYQKEQVKNGGTISPQQNDSSFNKLNSSFKARNPVIGISSIVYGSNKNVKKLHTNANPEPSK